MTSWLTYLIPTYLEQRLLHVVWLQLYEAGCEKPADYMQELLVLNRHKVLPSCDAISKDAVFLMVYYEVNITENFIQQVLCQH